MNQADQPAPALRAGPTTIVIFGATGDLTKRKLIPSLYNLATYGLVSPYTAIVGVAIQNLSAEHFREQLTQSVKQFGTQKIEPVLWQKFLERIYYCPGNFDDPAAYNKLGTLMADV